MLRLNEAMHRLSDNIGNDFGDLALGDNVSESFTLQGTWGSNTNLADNTTYYIGQTIRSSLVDVNTFRIPVRRKCVLKKCFISTRNTTAGSNESCVISLVVNGVTEYILTNSFEISASFVNVFSNANLNIPLQKGDYLCIKIVTPNWVTNPTGVGFNAMFWFDGVPGVQTGKYIIQGGSGTITGVASNNYFIYDTDFAGGSNATQARLYIPANGRIIAAFIHTRVGGTLGSPELVTYAIRLNNTTDYEITNSATLTALSNYFSNESLNIPVTQGQYLCLKLIGPAWVTPPTGMTHRFTFIIQR